MCMFFFCVCVCVCALVCWGIHENMVDLDKTAAASFSCDTVCVCMRPHPLREVERRDSQGPEAAEHGEDGQAQVVSRRDDDEVVLALAVAGAVRLHG